MDDKYVRGGGAFLGGVYIWFTWSDLVTSVNNRTPPRMVRGFGEYNTEVEFATILGVSFAVLWLLFSGSGGSSGPKRPRGGPPSAA